MPKKPESSPAEQAEPHQLGEVLARQRDGRIAGTRAIAQHQRTDDHHQHGEQGEQLVPIHHLAERRAEECAGDAGHREDGRAAPLHVPGPGVRGKIGRGIQRNRDCAGADRDMRIVQPDHIDQQRHRQDRAAATDKPEREAHDGARSDRKDSLQYRQIHRRYSSSRRARRPSPAPEP